MVSIVNVQNDEGRIVLRLQHKLLSACFNSEIQTQQSIIYDLKYDSQWRKMYKIYAFVSTVLRLHRW